MSREGVDAQPDPGDTRRTAGPVVASQPSILNSEKISPPVPPIENDQRRDATDEETKTLRHVNDRIPAAAWIVILAGAAERATYFGIIAPWRKLLCQSSNVPGEQPVNTSQRTTCKTLGKATEPLELWGSASPWQQTSRMPSSSSPSLRPCRSHCCRISTLDDSSRSWLVSRTRRPHTSLMDIPEAKDSV